VNRIDRLYQRVREEKRISFNAYLCAGYPDIAATCKLIEEFDRLGVDSIELGMPFSDPVADGPALQLAHLRGVESGLTLRGLLGLVGELRGCCEIPICLMSYYNPLLRYGEERLVRDAVGAGVDGLIVPDLPPEEAGALIAVARRYDLKTIFFIAPTTPPERVSIINHASTGFIYCISVTGVTGARQALPAELRESLRSLRTVCDKPLVVGFGVSTVEHIRSLREVCDGAIVGSGIARQLEGAPADLLHRARDYVMPLIEAVRCP